MSNEALKALLQDAVETLASLREYATNATVEGDPLPICIYWAEFTEARITNALSRA